MSVVIALAVYRAERRLLALLILSHNITYLYAVTLAIPFFLPYFLTPRCRERIIRIALAGGLHALLILWYVVPQMRTVDGLWGAVYGMFDPFERAGLTPLRILLAGMSTNTPMGAGTPDMGLQIGWPILGGLLLTLAGLIFHYRRARRMIAIRLICLFLLAFFLAWSPVDFWKYLPMAYWYIEFPYCALMFVVLFGTVLMALDWRFGFPGKYQTLYCILFSR